jgi:hypothetical protein
MSGLDPRITGAHVDPESELVWFRPFEGADEVVDPQLTADRLDATLRAAERLCGGSRSRRKAGALVFGAICSLAAGGYAIPERVMVVLAAVMRIRPTMIADKSFVGGEDRVDAPSRAETIALQLIAHCRQGPPTAVVRRTAFALLQVYRRRAQVVPAVVGNALGVAMGVLDPNWPEPVPEALRLLLGARDVERFRAAYNRDADELAATGRRMSGLDHSIMMSDDADQVRALRMWRHPAYGPYARAERVLLRKLTERQRIRDGLAAMHDRVWARYNGRG